MSVPPDQTQQVLLVPNEDPGWAHVRSELTALLGPTAVMETKQEREAICLAGRDQPRLALVASRLGDRPAMHLIAGLRAVLVPASTILVFSKGLSSGQAVALLDAGADGCLLWPELSPPLLTAILKALVISPVTICSRAVWDTVAADLQLPPIHPTRSVRFTPRESLVLGGLRRGLASAQIAEEAGLNERVVDRAITRLERKLDVPNSFGLGLRAGQLGLAADPPRAPARARRTSPGTDAHETRVRQVLANQEIALRALEATTTDARKNLRSTREMIAQTRELLRYGKPTEPTPDPAES